MILINFDKAKTIALKAAQHVQDQATRDAFAQSIGEAQDLATLAAVVEQIKTNTQSVNMN